MEIKHTVVSNVDIYGLEKSFKRSKYPMAVNVDECTDEYTPRVKKLGQAPKGSAHDNFLKGIIVQFDLSFTVKAWTEAERYHWFEIISSQSTMHKLACMNYDECFCGYVTENTKNEMKRLLDIYNLTTDAEEKIKAYLTLLYNCPVGIILTAGMTTNYQQLKTIYAQRKTHRLPEWRMFCEWIVSLPYSELITGKENTAEE